MDWSLPGSSVHGVSQIILERVVISFSRGSSDPDPGIEHVSPALIGGLFMAQSPRKPCL